MDEWSERGARLLADPLAFLRDLPTPSGGVSTFSIGGEIVHLLDDPWLMSDVFVTRREGFASALGFRHARSLLGPGVFSQGLTWPGMRLRASSLPTVVEEINARQNARQPGPVPDLFAEAKRLCLDALVTLIGAVHLSASPEVGAAIDRILETLNGCALPFVDPEARLSPEQAEGFRDAARALRTRVLAETRDSGLFDLLITTLLAGYEQSASVLVWFWSFLATYPPHEARFHEEIDAVLGGRDLDLRGLHRLRFSRALLQETIRLCPPVWLLTLRAKADHALKEGRIHARQFVVASPYRAHRDERFHLRPREFTPDRWLSERSGALPAFTYFPFGHGPRACRGESFVEDMLLALVVTLGRRWRVRLPGPPRLEARITLRPCAPVTALLERHSP